MENTVTKNLRTHYMNIKDGRKFAITTDQYRKMLQLRATEKPGAICYLTDADTGDIVFNGEYRAINEFTMICKKDKSVAGWFCGYGKKHAMQSSCGCRKKYGVSESEFRQKAMELYGRFDIVSRIAGGKEQDTKQYHGFYPQDLTPSQFDHVMMDLLG